VNISLSDGAGLRFEVRDDGAGFTAGTPEGAGLTNMRDRVSALGGDVEVASAAGAGTVVTGSIPVPS
jgi:signal transduction histidine kinase